MKKPELKIPDFKKPEFKIPKISSEISPAILRKYRAYEITAGLALSALTIIIAAIA